LVLGTALHTLHVLLAGVWLGGVVFTTFVVSPALAAMKWSEPERRYAKVGTVNLALLLLFAFLDGLSGGFGALLYVEYALLAALFGLVALHGACFGRRLAGLARSEAAAKGEQARALADRRRRLQGVSVRVSWVTLAVSVAVMALSVNAG
jgi:uncharacterized membrane protein